MIFIIAKVSSEILIAKIKDKIVFLRESRIKGSIQGFTIWGTLVFGGCLRVMNL